MTLWLALVYLLNFLAPAAAVGAGVAFAEGLLRRNGVSVRSLLWAVSVYFCLAFGVLLLGLVVWGRDGKVASYAMLVLAVGAVAAWRTRQRR